MSAALNARAESSSQSGLTLQDLSLGSLASFSTPAKYRVPSTSFGTTAPSSAPLNTPSPSGTHFSHRRTDKTTTPVTKRLAFSKLGDDDENDDRDVLDTPGNGKLEATGTPVTYRLSSKLKSGTVGTKGALISPSVIRKSIKLKVHFLGERLAQLAPDQINAAIKQNITLKIEVRQRGLEMKYRKLVLELERELERHQRARGRERELEEKHEDMERELREVRRRKGGAAPADERLRELNAELEDRQAQLETNEIEHLQEQLEQKGGVGHDSDVSGRRAKLKARIEELKAENEDLRVKLDDRVEVLTQREDEREDFLDEIQCLNLDVEDLFEHSDSRAQILEEREEREAIEEDLNRLRDKLTAAAIESTVAERDTDLKELRLHISELESNTTHMHNKFETVLAHLEHEAQDGNAEIESANREIERLGQRVYVLEDDVDQIRAESDRLSDDDAVEREMLDVLVSVLKEKVAQYKAELQDMTNLYEQVSQDILVHRARQEELARDVEDLVEEVRHERELCEKTELELVSQANRHESDLRHDRREFDAKDFALRSTLRRHEEHAKHALHLLFPRATSSSRMQSFVAGQRNREAKREKGGGGANANADVLGGAAPAAHPFSFRGMSAVAHTFFADDQGAAMVLNHAIVSQSSIYQLPDCTQCSCSAKNIMSTNYQTVHTMRSVLDMRPAANSNVSRFEQYSAVETGLKTRNGT
ncbi:hypothetical protein DFH11DRAFT_1749366, partial [Phellopilus nigrolimitatus]